MSVTDGNIIGMVEESAAGGSSESAADERDERPEQVTIRMYARTYGLMAKRKFSHWRNVRCEIFLALFRPKNAVESRVKQEF